MKNCDSEPTGNEFPGQNITVRYKFNHFYEINAQESNEHVSLSKYKFVSNYDDRFLWSNALEEKEDENLSLQGFGLLQRRSVDRPISN